MQELLNIKSQDRKPFRKHFLNSVHSEIRFVTEVSIDEILKSEEQLKIALASEGFIESRKINQVALSLSSENQSKVKREETPIGLLFATQNPGKGYQVQKDKIILSDSSYESFEDFNLKFKNCFEITSKILKLKNPTCNKVGLRKINSISVEPFSSFQEALSIFNPSLFSIPRSGVVRKEAFKASEEAVFIEKEDHICVIKTNLSRAKDSPSIDAGLDFDLVSLKGCPLNEAFERVLPSLNNSHFDLFMWAITPDMIKLMGSE